MSALAPVVCRCAFCGYGYTLPEFLTLPVAPSFDRAGRRDWSTIGDGGVAVTRDCPCRPEGQRTSLCLVVNGDGSVEVDDTEAPRAA